MREHFCIMKWLSMNHYISFQYWNDIKRCISYYTSWWQCSCYSLYFAIRFQILLSKNFYYYLFYVRKIDMLLNVWCNKICIFLPPIHHFGKHLSMLLEEISYIKDRLIIFSHHGEWKYKTYTSFVNL